MPLCRGNREQMHESVGRKVDLLDNFVGLQGYFGIKKIINLRRLAFRRIVIR